MVDYDIAETMDDIFGVPQDGSNVNASSDESQEGAYAEVSNDGGNATFEDKAAAVKETINGDGDVEYGDVPEPETPAPQAESQSEEPSHDSEPSSFEDILTDAISGEDNGGSKSPEVDDEPTADSEHPFDTGGDETSSEVRAEPPIDPQDETKMSQEEKPVETKAEEPTNEFDEAESESQEDEDGWILSFPSSKYDEFYREKRRALKQALVGGKLPVDRYAKELMDSRVDTRNVDMYAHDLIAEKMADIRMQKDRVLEIRGRVLRQYYKFQRTTEMLEGALARCQYEKPVIRQQGLNLIHLRDCENYLAELKYLVEFSSEVMKNLEAGYENMSRLVSMSMPNKMLEGYQSNPVPRDSKPAPQTPSSEPQNEEENKSDLSDFDGLKTCVEDKGNKAEKPKENIPPKKGNGSLDWGDID